MKYPKLDELEERARALLDDQAFVVVTFSNHAKRTMRLCDVIDLMRDGGGLRVVDVTGDGGSGNGQLLSLIKGLIDT